MSNYELDDLNGIDPRNLLTYSSSQASLPSLSEFDDDPSRPLSQLKIEPYMLQRSAINNQTSGVASMGSSSGTWPTTSGVAPVAVVASTSTGRKRAAKKQPTTLTTAVLQTPLPPLANVVLTNYSFAPPQINGTQEESIPSGQGTTSGTSNANVQIDAQNNDNTRDSNLSLHCIDLTKDNDDILVIQQHFSASSRANKGTRRRNANRNQPNELIDVEAPLVTNAIRRENPNHDLNVTIIIDDESFEHIEINPNRGIPVTAAAASVPAVLFNAPELPVPTSSRSRAPRENTPRPNDEIATILSPIKRIKTTHPAPQVPQQPKTSVAAAQSASSSSFQCPICLENLEELKQRSKQIMSTLCGHIFCNTCLMEHLQSTGVGATKTFLCPTCRTKLNKSKIHSLYL